MHYLNDQRGNLDERKPFTGLSHSPDIAEERPVRNMTEGWPVVMKIELYIESMNVIIEGKNPYYNTAAGKGIVGMWHGRTDDCQSVKKGYFNISEKENKIKNELEIIAKKHGIKLKIFDISKTLHALRASIKGVHVTPTVIVNSHKFEDDIDANEILKCLGPKNK